MKKVHVVLHTHWDREWYFTTSDSLVLLDHVITDIIDVLNDEPKLIFCLDGQISILEDYLSIRAEKYPQLQKLVDSGQLIIGPWYTQTDTFYVHGESIVNNLYYGIYESLRLFGTYMKVAYLPDTFGFSQQLPMIASGFGIENGIIWRGVDFESDQIEPYFIWQSLGKDCMKTAVLHGGYGAFKKANVTDLFIHKKLKPLLSEIEEKTVQKQLLMPVGNDQHNITSDILNSLKTYGENFEISSYEKFFDDFDSQISPLFQGEFRHPRYARVHRSSGGIRVDIKQSNYRAEQQLLRITQPMLVLANQLDLPVSNGIVSKAWKKLFEGQAHDGIVGCVSDDVAKDILNRNKQAYELAKSQENLIKKSIAHRLSLKQNEIVVFNPMLHPQKQSQIIELFTYDKNVVFDNVEYSEMIETQLIKGHENALVEKPEGNYYQKEDDYYLHKILIKTDIPSLGYRVLSYHKANELPVTLNKNLLENEIKNEQYHFFIENKKLVLKTKTRRYDDFIRIVDQGNAGDSYDFSPMSENNSLIYFNLEHSAVTKRSYSQEMTLRFSAKLPKTLEARQQNSFTESCVADVTIFLVNNEKPIITLHFVNDVLNHNMRIAFQLGEKATKSIASSPFGFVSRAILQSKNIPDWQKENLEMPIDIHPNSGVVGIESDNDSLWVFNKGVKEYQVIDNYLYMTCFSSTDELGKADLLYRPGRASGDITKKGHVRIFTPMAQVLGEHEYVFSVGEFASITDALLAFENFEQPACFYQEQDLNLFYERIDNKIDIINKPLPLPKQISLFTAAFDDNFVTSMYLSLYDQQPIIRFYAIKNTVISDDIKNNYEIGDLLENSIEINELEAFKLYTARKK